MIELAGERPRFGYRRLWLFLNREFGPINRKRVERLYRLVGLKVRRKNRKRFKPLVKEKFLLTGPNQEWAMDFVHDQLATGQRIRTLSIIDSFTRECLALEVDTSLPSVRVIRALDEIAHVRSLPKVIRTDNGPEFTSRRFLAWAMDRQVRPATIEPGKPIQNAHIESFNGRFRDECLNVHWFENLQDARRKVGQWQVDYNELRPHSSLGNQTPAMFRQTREENGNIQRSKEEESGSPILDVSNSENRISGW
jgi:putative transposase